MAPDKLILETSSELNRPSEVKGKIEFLNIIYFLYWITTTRLQIEGKSRMENPEMPRYCCCDVIKGAWVWSILWMIVRYIESS